MCWEQNQSAQGLNKYSMIMQDHIHEWLIKPVNFRQFWIIPHVAIPIAIIV